MKIEEIRNVVKEEVFIAEDGKRFSSKEDCIRHEAQCAIESLAIPELERVIPLCTDGEVHYDNAFTWYKLENEEQFNLLKDAHVYLECGNCPAISEYPEIVCVENGGDNYFGSDSYLHTLDQMFAQADLFWEKLGFRTEYIRERLLKTKGDR